jgi:hypothetical protein
MAEKVALGQVFSEYFGFPLSVSFHLCSTTWKRTKNNQHPHLHHTVAQEALKLRCVRSACCGTLLHLKQRVKNYIYYWMAARILADLKFFVRSCLYFSSKRVRKNIFKNEFISVLNYVCHQATRKNGVELHAFSTSPLHILPLAIIVNHSAKCHDNVTEPPVF